MAGDQSELPGTDSAMIKTIIFLFGVIPGLSMAVSGPGQLAHASPGACIPLTSSQGTSSERWSVRIYRPGNYCLSQDLKQTEVPAWLRLPHMAVPHDPLMVSESGNVSIDLAGHSMVTTTAAGQGMMHLGGAAWTDGKEHPHIQAARNILLRNGSISTKFQPAVIMVHRWNGDNKRFDGKKVGGHFLLGARLTDSRGDIDLYESTDYVLENLTLTSDQIVVLMQGKNNIIRRCKIIGANAAVNLYGPNLVFEDNEIVMTARDPADAGGEPQVALYVEDGFGAVIRNNRFLIKGRPDGAVAMEFRNAAGVVLEGNTVEGKASLYRTLDEKSTVEVRPAAQRGPLVTRQVFSGASAVAQAAATCQPIQPRQGGGAVLTRPGLHCVTRDMLVDSRYRPFAHGSGTALWIYSPDARIENNTIIVRGRGRVREADAPIRLHHGDGAIIRNNRIVVKGDGHPWAITSFRTGAITLEGNTMNGKPIGPEGIKVFADDIFQLTETTGVL